MQGHDRAGIADRIAGLVRLAPLLGEQWLALAGMAADNGEFDQARAILDIHSAQNGSAPIDRYKRAALLAQVGDWQAAHAILSGLEGSPIDPAALAHSRGTAAMFLGLAQLAREQLELATRLAPQSGASWQALSMVVNFAQEPHLADALLDAGRSANFVSARNHAAWLNAAGKSLHDQGDHAGAFAAFDQSAQILRQALPYDPQRDAFLAEAATRGYTPQAVAGLARRRQEPNRSIFVTGLPRSGTTLLEQILTSHSEVSDGAELNHLGLLAKEIGGPDFAAVNNYANHPHKGDTAPTLWQRWLDQRFGPQGRIVDKTNNSSRMLGLAACLLPAARLVWLVRDPLDCAWSCFRTWFSSAQPWSNRQEDIAHHFRLEDDLRRRWQDILGDRLLVLRYEDLARDPAGTIPRLLAHCGLADEPAVYAPHRNSRPVTTSSAMQVRQPISPMGIGAAAPYRAHLEPFLAAYHG